MMYPNETKSVAKHWKKFSSFILPYLKKTIKDKATKQRLLKISSAHNEEENSMSSNIILYFLPQYILKVMFF